MAEYARAGQMLELARTASDVSLIWTRFLVPDPSWLYPSPCREERVIWSLRSSDLLLDVHVFGDGSGLHGRYARFRRCGWGLCSLDSNYKEIARMHGPLPTLFQSVPAAELYIFDGVALHDGAAKFLHGLQAARRCVAAGAWSWR